MLGIQHFGVFLATCVVLNVTPGTDNFYILGRSLSQGRRAGIASVLGITSGTIVHTFAAALGLSALVAASATAFLVIKLAGALYLAYLGLRMLMATSSTASLRTEFSSPGFLATYRQGLLINVLNPKVALFFLAFMPQFISADSTDTFLAFTALGMSFVLTSLVWCFFLVWCSTLLGNRLRGDNRILTWLNRSAGALFVFLGIRLALTD